MPVCNRNLRHRRRCQRSSETVEATVVTDRRDCCNASETIAEELYHAANKNVMMMRCCDSFNGCREIDARRRCEFWPKFAHPRWLACSELNNTKRSSKC